MDALAIVLWTAAAGGLVSAGIAMVRPNKRRPALLVAASLFLPIGILGILSVGAMFLLLAALCLIGAAVSTGSAMNPPEDASS